MIAPEFLDTDVLVYAYDLGSPKKRKTARVSIIIFVPV